MIPKCNNIKMLCSIFSYHYKENTWCVCEKLLVSLLKQFFFFSPPYPPQMIFLSNAFKAVKPYVLQVLNLTSVAWYSAKQKTQWSLAKTNLLNYKEFHCPNRNELTDVIYCQTDSVLYQTCYHHFWGTIWDGLVLILLVKKKNTNFNGNLSMPKILSLYKWTTSREIDNASCSKDSTQEFVSASNFNKVC